MLTKHIGKGEKNSLKRVKVLNERNEVIEECQDKLSIEQEIAKYNKKYFRKAYSSNAYKDIIYMQLKIDQVRDKILEGRLRKEECDDERVFEFMKLLKVPIGFRQHHKEILIADWEKVVKRSKKQSASSIFSKRIYANYKCALGCKRMTKILVTYYNILIEKGYYPRRWLKILDTILEKGKGMILGKLRTITLIEADLQYVMRLYLKD